MKNLKISGYGKALPKRVVTNDDLKEFVDTNDEWIVQRTGIKKRRIGDEGVSILATDAAKMALEDANLAPCDIDLIICSTVTADQMTPSIACMVQKNLGISDSDVTAFDLNSACTGFIFAFKTAAAMLNSFHKRALVIGAETVSRITDFTDRSTCILFGDAAGAVVLEKTETDKEMYFYTNCKGDDRWLSLKGVKSNVNMNNRTVESGFTRMKGDEVFKFALRANDDAIDRILEQAGIKTEDIDFVVPHQANLRIIEAIAKRTRLPMEKFFINLSEYGNTSSASVPLALCEAHENGMYKEGDRVLLLGFGGGLSWGSILIEF